MAIDDYVASRPPVELLTYTVTEFIDYCNLALEQTFPLVYIEGEVSSFKINQKKWVFFDLKENDQTLSCFLPISRLTFPVADGMKVRVRAMPKLTRWGKFSLVIDRIIPLGEGNLKKSLELLRQKLMREGLFDPNKKRTLPTVIQTIGVISSVNAAGYADFLKILNARWSGLRIITAHVQVQGLSAPEQIIRALRYFNQSSDVDVIAILRGGGSADDLAAFNDEELVRSIAASRIPTITGIGHEVDESLADLAADLRASTPSNAAELLTPDKMAVVHQVKTDITRVFTELNRHFQDAGTAVEDEANDITTYLLQKIKDTSFKVTDQTRLLDSMNPEQVLKRGYALLTGKLSPGASINLTTYQFNIQAEVKNVQKRSKN